MLADSTAGRIAITVAIAALAALVGFLAGRTTDDEAASAATPPQPPAAGALPAGEAELRRELSQLATTRAAELVELRRARTPANRERAAEAIAVAYGDAATVSAGTERAAQLARLTQALRSAAGAWRRVALAAGAKEPSDYNSARALVRRSEQLVAQRLEANLTPGSDQ